ncbi:GNAT family N-acetyltransferase [Alkalihalophilus marmarensis]|uniref:N-acetyltransferase GCN5 n=1 Tax=Alkalihalophilus marmarensis DSM 21297 TaxID=1188261 RepID=U6SQG7_9BACI|nr:GNAT family N-acetyltransferase [Alkalihalophilus marmarensis]ERN53637.1 N-acetyltransferase GCN5 [Alkalihalophilus marmarensis DSM 21297]
MLTLETERLTIRPFTKEDIPALHTIFSDPETMQHYPAPFSYEKTKSWVEKNLQRYQKDGHGLWAVCFRETGEVIGDCGLVTQQVEGKKEIELGYHINKKHWSKGYATEAAVACRDYGFQQLKVDRLISLIVPKNKPSIRVAEKIGFGREKEVLIFYKYHYIYAGFRQHESKGDTS